jgi:DNA-binding CsgD family transcriptional regulator
VSTREIALELGISTQRVNQHLRAIRAEEGDRAASA